MVEAGRVAGRVYELRESYMRSHSRPIVFAAGLLLAGAALFSGPGTTCVPSFLGESALTSDDFCFIFDCQNGILGGSFDPCTGTDAADQSGEQPLFTDCPNFVAP